MKFLRIIGAGITIVYAISFIVLFIVSHQAYAELEYLSVTAFNLLGFSHRLQVVLVNYISVGLLIVVFGIGISTKFRKSNVSRYGSYLIALSGLSWASFGVLNGNNEVFGSLHMIRIVICWLFGIVGLILLSVDLERSFKPYYLKWMTLSIALVMLLESLYFMIGEYSGTVSAIAWTIYMSWFLIFSITVKPL